MELLQLEYFTVIAHYENLTKAAEHLKVSQSSLSSMLSRIEKELDVKLFDRQGRTITLNEYGQVLQHHAHNVLQEIQQMHNKFNELKVNQGLQLSVGCVHARLLSTYTTSFMKQGLLSKFSNEVTSLAELKTALLAGRLDFAISLSPISPQHFNQYTLAHDEFVICVPPNHHLAHRSSVRFEDLVQESFVTFPKNNKGDRFLDVLCSKAGIEPNIIYQGEPELISDLFVHLNGIIISLKSFEHPKDTIVTIPLMDHFGTVDVILSWPKNKSLSPICSQFLNYLKDHYPQPID